MTAPQAGDFALIRSTGFVAWAIRVATRSRYSHAAFFVSDTHVVEAEGAGAVISPWSKYKSHETVTSAGNLGVGLTPVQRAAAYSVGFHLIGTPYDWLDILSIGCLQYGLRLKWAERRTARPDRLICSELVDQARLALGDHLFHDGRGSQDVTPGDLAKLLGYR